jgi:hypothetical protein
VQASGSLTFSGSSPALRRISLQPPPATTRSSATKGSGVSRVAPYPAASLRVLNVSSSPTRRTSATNFTAGNGKRARKRAHRRPRQLHALHRGLRRHVVDGEDGHASRLTLRRIHPTSNQPPTAFPHIAAERSNFTSLAKISLVATAADADGSGEALVTGAALVCQDLSHMETMLPVREPRERRVLPPRPSDLRSTVAELLLRGGSRAARPRGAELAATRSKPTRFRVGYAFVSCDAMIGA